MEAILEFLGRQGPLLLYSVLGAGSALENIFPPVPADTFVLLGAFLASGGRANATTVFFVTWLSNTLSALLVYWTGLRYGRPFFQVGMGRYLLNSRQLRLLGDFYRRWGLPAIFLARFIPGLRAMVPVFAGVTHQKPLVVAFPVLVASAIWHGALVWLGATAGRNLPAVLGWLGNANRLLLGVGLLLLAMVILVWLRTRRSGEKEEE